MVGEAAAGRVHRIAGIYAEAMLWLALGLAVTAALLVWGHGYRRRALECRRGTASS